MNDEHEFASAGSENPENGQQDPEWIKRAEAAILRQLAREFAGFRFAYQLGDKRLTSSGRVIPGHSKLLMTIVLSLDEPLPNLDPDCAEPCFLHGVRLSPERRDCLIDRALKASGGLQFGEPEDSFGSPIQPRPKPRPVTRPGLRGDGLIDLRLYGGKR